MNRTKDGQAPAFTASIADRDAARQQDGRFNATRVAWQGLRLGTWSSPPSGLNLGVGTNRLANTTMETYQQGGTNCFRCHQTFQTPPTLNPNGISHIFGDATTGLKPLF